LKEAPSNLYFPSNLYVPFKVLWQLAEPGLTRWPNFQAVIFNPPSFAPFYSFKILIPLRLIIFKRYMTQDVMISHMISTLNPAPHFPCLYELLFLRKRSELISWDQGVNLSGIFQILLSCWSLQHVAYCVNLAPCWRGQRSELIFHIWISFLIIEDQYGQTAITEQCLVRTICFIKSNCNSR